VTNLQYDKDKWKLTEPELANRVQMFITNKCNKRCKGCFYGSQLDNSEMTFEEYKEKLDPYISKIGKVILLGGEPTISPHLQEMIEYNQDLELSTTIYTNGYKLLRSRKPHKSC
jgi:MoaA/NifB/PqqE/SkfB family radical SAM enzyme